MSSDSRRSTNARIAALTRVAREGGTAVSAPARAKFDEKFVDQVDPDRVLSDDERARRVSALRRAYFLGLAAKSADVRRRKSEAAELRRLADEIEAGAPPGTSGLHQASGERRVPSPEGQTVEGAA